MIPCPWDGLVIPFATTLLRASPCSAQAVFRGGHSSERGRSLLEEGWWVGGGDGAGPGGISTEAENPWSCPECSRCDAAATQIHVPRWVSSRGMVALAWAGDVGGFCLWWGSRTIPGGTGQCLLLRTGCKQRPPCAEGAALP